MRAQQEAKNMAGIDLQIGCLKALVDSQKRVILEDQRLKTSQLG